MWSFCGKTQWTFDSAILKNRSVILCLHNPILIFRPKYKKVITCLQMQMWNVWFDVSKCQKVILKLQKCIWGCFFMSLVHRCLFWLYCFPLRTCSWYTDAPYITITAPRSAMPSEHLRTTLPNSEQESSSRQPPQVFGPGTHSFPALPWEPTPNPLTPSNQPHTSHPVT